MSYIFLTLAILVLIIAHLIKIYRWKLFIGIYEIPKDKILLNSLSWGYLINTFIPFHIGDLFRAFISGRKMKNGVSFSLATIIVDRFLDILIIAILFISLYFLGFRSKIVLNSVVFYIFLFIFIVLFILFGIKNNKCIKHIIKNISSIFNKSIELKILKTTWFTINTFKDLLNKISKLKLFSSTFFMWGMYFISYALFALSLKSSGYNVGLIDILLSLFASGNMQASTIGMIINLTDIGLMTLVYLIVPVIIMLIYSYFIRENVPSKNTSYINIVPHIKENDRLAFLEAYFEGNNREYFKNYMKINSDISIIQDYSAGSNATTMLCTDDTSMFYRKYAFGSAGQKLYEQVNWIIEHQKAISLTSINNIKKSNGYCCYDMPYLKESIGCFNYIHSTDVKTSWNLLEKVLNDLEKNLYCLNKRIADSKSIKKYIESKVINNLKILPDSKELKELEKYDYLIINGKKYKNFKHFEKYLNSEYLYNIFKNDKYSDIHGDLTIENIICMQTGKNNYYIIDPNTGNIHDSANLDYAKLLQSLHGGYEFLMHTPSVDVVANKINYMRSRTSIYDEIFEKYKDYLEQKFGLEKTKSIFYHEIVHWLRLLPYKINKDRDRFIMFYAGFIIVLNEVIEFYEK